MPYKDLAPINTLSELNYGMDVKYVDLKNDIRLAYVEKGAGDQTIIFIHGLGSYLPAWKKNLDELSQNYRCIAVDLPGYGKSSKLPHSGMMSFYASVIVDLIDELELKNVVLAGHSMGGQISITTALLYPNKVSKLILAAPAGFERFHEGQKQWFRDVMTVEGVKLTTTEGIINNLTTNFYKMPADAEFMITDRIAMRSASDFEAYCYAVVQSVNGMVSEPVIDYLSQINKPTLILFGENDNLIPNRYLNPGFTEPIAKHGASQIKDSQLFMIEKCGHFLMFEKPEVFNQKVKEFLK